MVSKIVNGQIKEKINFPWKIHSLYNILYKNHRFQGKAQ